MNGCRPLNFEEVLLVTDWFRAKGNLRDLALWVFLLYTGRRISQVLTLRVKNVSRPSGEIVSWVDWPGRFTKAGRDDQVPLHENVKWILEALVEKLRGRGPWRNRYLFRSRTGRNRAITRFRAYRILKEAFAACGVFGKTGCHTLRKTFGNQVYEEDRDIFFVAEVLGHSDPRSTAHYLQVNREKFAAAFMTRPNILPDRNFFIDRPR